MAAYVLIHGAGDSAFYWHLVAAELEQRGSEVVAVDLPCEDESAGLTEYADTVVEAIGERREPILVAQSFGGFTAPLVAARLPVGLIVLVAGMVPLPGEKGDEWTASTAYPGPASDGDDLDVFYHDVPPALAAEALAHGRGQAEAPGRQPWPLTSWPDVPTRYLLCRDDRMFPARWTREVVRERLGIVADEIDGGHCPALSRPHELVTRLEAYRTELDIR
ncbi:MAG TPA: alpha/beta hydrolase [Solirubrobacterales bacterium]|nr:alpha/beta hydrolase [Solirubrobacterales bacterium]